MIALLIITAILGYIGVGAWMFGYIRGTINDYSGFDTPLPLFGAVAWPISLLIMLAIPLQKMGLASQKKQVEKKKVRIELQKKARIELEQVEKELEEEFRLMEEAEQANEKTKQKLAQRKKMTINEAFQELDGALRSKRKRS